MVGLHINSAKKVRKHCIDEGIFQQQGVYQTNEESITFTYIIFTKILSTVH